MHLYKDCTIIEITFNSHLQLIVLTSEGYEYSWKAIVFVLKYLRACSIYWTDWCLKSVFLKVVGQNSSIKCFWVRPNLMALIHKQSSNAAVLMSLLVSNPMTLVCSSFCWPRNSSFILMTLSISVKAETWFSARNTGIKWFELLGVLLMDCGAGLRLAWTMAGWLFRPYACQKLLNVVWLEWRLILLI